MSPPISFRGTLGALRAGIARDLSLAILVSPQATRRARVNALRRRSEATCVREMIWAGGIYIVYMLLTECLKIVKNMRVARLLIINIKLSTCVRFNVKL